ncbi:2,3 cyclic-nucleotide 2-phosphodiesterase [Hippea maritima DSM 10411]|uniref:Ribonuclease Y n=2 Tax=Hippea TaxID=84404 RepID=F2LTR3_HIPMA|nr:ribonuclease Y [Hippea maritima]AEA34439.1 2,3 cyclic-nucleotide 2-phosphodiesterase [Hippea maritima DSM 10411]
MGAMEIILIIGLSVIVGVLGGIFGYHQFVVRKKEYAKQRAEDIIKDAEKEKENILKAAQIEAQEFMIKAKKELEEEEKQTRKELQKWEKRLQAKETNLEKRQAYLDEKIEFVNKKQEDISAIEKELEDKMQKIDDMINEQKKKLEEISGMTSDEAKQQLISSIEDEAKREAAAKIKKIEEDLRNEAKRLSQDILITSMEKIASSYVAERTVATVTLPNDEMKGRIIGREGRNIRSFEKETGTDLIIDDTPEVVVISSFNPLRREIAKIALERLVNDGRIHPARIEETVEKVREELFQEAAEEAKKVVFDLDIGDLHPELMKYLGLLKYRTSYTQNVLAHSVEVAYLAGLMASELGLNVKLAKRAGLLHDIGKAVDQEVEGSHTKVGADLAKKYGENEYVINAIMSHHGEIEPNCPESVLVSIADTLSAARPGARRERLESYIQRLEELEEIAKSKDGVKEAYAIQAGRELRVIVEPTMIDDDKSFMIARDIAKNIAEKITYTGQVKIVVIREKRSIEYAN